MENQIQRRNRWVPIVLALLVAAVGVESYFLYSLHHRLDKNFSEFTMIQEPQAPAQPALTTSSSNGGNQGNTAVASNIDPFTDVQDQLAQLWTFQHVLNELSPFGLTALYTQPDLLNAALQPRSLEAMTMPRIDNGKDHIVVTMSVPGLNKSDIKTQIQGENLTINGTQKNVIEKKQGDHVIANEQINRQFTSTLTLPSHVQADKMKVSYNHDLLTITLPKA